MLKIMPLFSQHRSILYKVLGYGLFIVLLAGVLLHLLFPSEDFRSFLVSSVSRKNPRLVLKINTLSPCFFLNFKLTQVELFLKGNDTAPLFNADQVILKPALLASLLGNLSVKIIGTTSGGNITAAVRLKKNKSTETLAANIELKDIRISDLKYILTSLGYTADGILAGKITYTGDLADPISGSGSMSLDIKAANIKLSRPLFGFNMIDLNNAQVEAVLKNRLLSLSKVDLNGQRVKAEIKGTIHPHKIIRQSRLDLNGRLEFTQGLPGETGTKEPQKIPFVLKGTIAMPELN